MCLVKIVFAVFAWTTVTNHVFVSGQENEETTEPPPSQEEKTEPPPVENHTFVALIDIAFVDGTKRQCTGTIVHDNVIVTAAHCFLDHGPESVDIELSDSFVVIGTKKMFDTGYENYLPIERIVTHPKYNRWTADLALVFTYAGLTTDKPGYALPLLEEGESTPVDSNVTILSWGRCPDNARKPPLSKWKGETKRPCASTEEENESCEARGTGKPLRSGLHQSEPEHSSEGDKSDLSIVNLGVTTVPNSHRALATVREQKLSQDNLPDNPKQSNETPEPYERPEPTPLNATIELDNHTISVESSLVGLVAAEPEVKKKENLTKALRRHRKRYQKSSRNMPIVNVKKKEKALRRHRKRSHHKASRDIAIVHAKDQKWPKDQILVERRSGRNASLDGKTTKSYNKNWRRKAKLAEPKENTLTVETFGFVNVQTCKKLVDKVMPSHGINTNEVVCYSAEEHYISDDDSGAPAVRKGHLVAVTVGGVECDGDHVAIGMKMNCFCSWIAENLPEKNVDWKCCKDCCSGDEPKKPRKLRHKNY